MCFECAGFRVVYVEWFDREWCLSHKIYQESPEKSGTQEYSSIVSETGTSPWRYLGWAKKTRGKAET